MIHAQELALADSVYLPVIINKYFIKEKVKVYLEVPGILKIFEHENYIKNVTMKKKLFLKSM